MNCAGVYKAGSYHHCFSSLLDLRDAFESRQLASFLSLGVV